MQNNDTNKFIEEGLKEIDREVQQEEDIDQRAEHLVLLLEKNPKVKVEYNDDVYDVALKTSRNIKGQQVIILMAASHKKMREALLTNRPYKNPNIYAGEYNDEFSYGENVRVVVKAFLGHVTGNFKVETLEDEGSVKVVKERK